MNICNERCKGSLSYTAVVPKFVKKIFKPRIFPYLCATQSFDYDYTVCFEKLQDGQDVSRVTSGVEIYDL